MKKSLGILVILMIFLTACGSYEGTVTEKKESSFIMELPSDDPAKKTTLEMHLTDGTIFKGSISTFDELEEGDQVRVIPFDVPEDFSAILPSEVIVE